MDTGKISFSSKDEWLAMDLYRFSHSLNILYNRLYILQYSPMLEYPKLKHRLDFSLYFVDENKALTIDSLSIQSPALFNFKGDGRIIETLWTIVKECINWKYERRDRELQTFDKEIQIYDRTLDTVFKEIKLHEYCKDRGYSDHEIKQTMGSLNNPIKKLSKTIQDKDIEAIEPPKNNKDKKDQ